MAAPKRKTSKPAKPRGARILVVEARFYDDISRRASRRRFEGAR